MPSEKIQVQRRAPPMRKMRTKGMAIEVAKLRSERVEVLNDDPAKESQYIALERLTSAIEPRFGGFDSPLGAENIGNLLQRAVVLRACFIYYIDRTGPLFCCYSHADAEALFLQITNGPVPWTRPLLCEVCAVGAVSAGFSGGRIPVAAEDSFYSLAKMFMDDCIEASPASAVKICTLLAARDVVARPTVALAYVELGLGLARNRGPDLDARRAETESGRTQLRKSTRCLMTMQVWLQATLGWCLEDADAADDLIFSDVGFEVPRGLGDSDLFRSKLTDICLLRQEMSQVLAAEELPLKVFVTLRRSLGVWYDTLPSGAHISNLAATPLDSVGRFSLYYLHLIHLSAILLLFRQFVRQYARRGGRSELAAEGERWACDGPQAARQVARLTFLLCQEGDLLRHCWGCISQAYFAGCVLIHVCLQRLLTGRMDAEWYDDVELIHRTLASLSDCARLDRVAHSLEERLRSYLGLLCEAATSREQFGGSEGWQDEANLPDGYLLTCAPGDTKHHAVAKELLHAIGGLRDDDGMPERREHPLRTTLVDHEECIGRIYKKWIEEVPADGGDADESAVWSKARQIVPLA
ncbi:hypothetical protein NKR23_g10931 [Pleurostoma richardsiae]|uniref:Uncharacterized protein n=1 Tax=Pleurostoma richardsiae TaxID=41990 RepID=A0AA38VHW1_9PEZI|nr:hypothetical protein NKR23_g10931 [Pleurostoma richardsiae]